MFESSPARAKRGQWWRGPKGGEKGGCGTDDWHEGVQTGMLTGTMAALVVDAPPMAPFFLTPTPAAATTFIMIERMPEGLSPLPSRRQPKPQRL